MEEFLRLLKENPKKAIVIAIAILVVSIGFSITGCALKADEITIKQLDHQIGKFNG